MAASSLEQRREPRSRPQRPLIGRLRGRAWRLYKKYYWKYLSRAERQHKILFVVGDAKCGKTTLCNLLDQDVQSKLFRERSEVTGRDGVPQRLKKHEDMRRIIAQRPEPLIVIEAKVDSQHTSELLDAFDQSYAIWMYRHYRPAVNACLGRFRLHVEAIVPIVKGDVNNWRSEGVSSETRKTVADYYSDTMSDADAAALMWYARNKLVFDRELQRCPQFRLCKYEHLVQDSRRVLDHIYAWIGLSPPRRVRPPQHGPSHSDPPISPSIADLCRSLENDLDHLPHQAS